MERNYSKRVRCQSVDRTTRALRRQRVVNGTEAFVRSERASERAGLRGRVVTTRRRNTVACSARRRSARSLLVDD